MRINTGICMEGQCELTFLQALEPSIIYGFLGGVVAVIVCSIISRRVRNASVKGELKFGIFLALIAWACLGMALLAFSALFIDGGRWDRKTELYSAAGLGLAFGMGAFYCFSEYFKVHGSFDEQGISFNTPWTGKKVELWSDLETVTFNTGASWYRLTFKSGAIIRLSILLSGHGKVLDFLRARGYQI